MTQADSRYLSDARQVEDEIMPTRILLAEDEPVIHQDLKEELISQGYAVVGDVDNGASAVALARELRPAIEVALVRYREQLALESQVADLENALTTRKVVEKAVGILREKHGLTEQEAFRRISKLARSHRESMREVAETILLAEDLLADTPK